ncbi:hypothetical protein BDD43_3387 [Mucilaginibacter gracilis]|uniref:Uncharacterized protein n=1 Tax=Mucilaginibacter gracilis TaxID=423350 RepID=A0A495J2I6_9SPHI|nr:hypothetical protein [Mucilaginibacter gracilis]RKR83185.1 hypothetical protein BDD43_3387 [Mucilaginibacter gracilis]
MRDYLCTNTGDLLITNGDFAKGRSEQKHVRLLMMARPGSLRLYGLSGVGAIDYKNASFAKMAALRNKIVLQLELAGFKSPQVTINPDKTIDFDV